MKPATDQRLAVFSWLIAAATLCHFWNQVVLPNGVGRAAEFAPFFHPTKLVPAELLLGQALGWISLLSALGLLLRPSSRHLIAAHTASVLAFVAATFPHVPDHLILEASVLACLGVTLIRRGGHASPATVFDGFAPAARWCYLISYGASALAKYNSDFFDPETSCVSWLNRGLGQSVLSAPDTPFFTGVGIAVTIAVETGVPLLLLVPRARKYAIFAGAVFHFAIASSRDIRVFDFTATLYPCWVLFLPGKTLQELYDGVASRLRSSAALRGGAVLTVVALGMSIALQDDLFGRDGNRYLRWLVFDAYALALMIYGLRRIWRSGEPPPTTRSLLWSPSIWHGPVLLLVVANVLAPYLGAKNMASFGMFSNLRTESGRENHFLLSGVGFLPYQDDPVEIVQTDHRWLREMSADRRDLVPYFEVTAAAWSDPDATIIYRRGDDIGRSIPEEDLPHFWERKLILVRAVPPPGAFSCGN